MNPNYVRRLEHVVFVCFLWLYMASLLTEHHSLNLNPSTHILVMLLVMLQVPPRFSSRATGDFRDANLVFFG